MIVKEVERRSAHRESLRAREREREFRSDRDEDAKLERTCTLGWPCFAFRLMISAKTSWADGGLGRAG